MDPISLGASLIALYQVTSHLSAKLIRYVHGVKQAKSEAQSLIEEIQNFQHYLLQASSLLQDENTSAKEPSDRLKALRELLKPGSLLIKNVEDDIAKISSRIAEDETKRGGSLRNQAEVLLQKLKWPLREEEINKLKDDMNRIQTQISSAQAMDNTQTVRTIDTNTKAILTTVRQVEKKQQTKDEEGKRQQEKDQLEATRKQVVGWLRHANQEESHENAVKARSESSNTGRWFLDGDKFAEWKESTHSLLWLHGAPGAGKTVLSSTIIENLRSSAKSDGKIVLAFWYFTAGEKAKTNAGDCARSVITQFMRAFSSYIPQAIEDFWKSTGKNEQIPKTSELYATIRRILTEEDMSFFVVFDALDEVREEETNEVFNILQTLLKPNTPNIHVLVTSRQGIKEKFEEQVPEHTTFYDIGIERAHVDEDIRSYLSEQLKSDPVLSKCDEKLKNNISETLLEKAEGMFRWVDCQLQALRRCKKRSAFDKVLKTLPKNLEEQYKRELLGITEPNDPVDVLNLLKWLTYPRRKLRVDEVVDVLAVNYADDDDDIEELEFDSSNRYDNPSELISICGSLVRVEHNEDGKNHLGEPSPVENLTTSHNTVLEFLKTQPVQVGDLDEVRLSSAKINRQMALTSLAYLFSLFHKEEELTVEKLAEYPAARLCAELWDDYYREAINDPREKVDMTKLNEMILHLMDSKTEMLKWVRICDPDNDNDPVNLSFAEEHIQSPMYYASLLGLPDVVQHYIDQEEDVNLESKTGYGSPLGAAAYANRTDIVKMLLAAGASIKSGGTWSNGKAVAIAVAMDAVDILKEFMKQDDFNVDEVRYDWESRQIQAAPDDDDSGDNENADGEAGDDAEGNLEADAEKQEASAAETGQNSEAVGAVAEGEEGEGEEDDESSEDEEDDDDDDDDEEEEEEEKDNDDANKEPIQKGVADEMNKEVQTEEAGAEEEEHTKNPAEEDVADEEHGEEATACQDVQEGDKDVEVSGENEGEPIEGGGEAEKVEGEVTGENQGQSEEPNTAETNTAQPAEDPYTDEKERSSETLLYIAARYASPQAFDILMDAKADINKIGGSFMTPVRAAAYAGSNEMVEKLLDSGADVKVYGGGGGSLLVCACYGLLKAPLVRRIIDEGCGVQVNQAIGLNFNALYVATRVQTLDVIKLIIEQGGVINDRENGEYDNCLQAACVRGDAEIVKLLLQHGADMSFQGAGTYDNCLEAAIVNCNSAVVDVLLDAGMSPDLKGGKYAYPMIAAAFQNRRDDESATPIFDSLLRHGANPYVYQEEEGDYDNCFASQQLQTKGAIDVFVKHGVDLNRSTDLYVNLLSSRIITSDPIGTIDHIISKGVDVNALHARWGRPLTIACRNQRPDVIRSLLKVESLDINAVNEYARGAALHVAAREAYMDILQLLLEANANINVEHWCFGTPFLVASDDDIQDFLYQRGADIFRTNLAGQSALHKSVMDARFAFADRLVGWGLSSELRDKFDASILHYAARSGEVEAVQKYLDMGFDPNAQDKYGWTVLHYASTSANLTAEVISELLSRGAKREIVDTKGLTALDYAFGFQMAEEAGVLRHPDINLSEEVTCKYNGTHSVWQGFYCDGCAGKRGTSYSCKTCSEYDLCFHCYEFRDTIHDPEHEFDLKTENPLVVPKEKGEKQSEKCPLKLDWELLEGQSAMRKGRNYTINSNWDPDTSPDQPAPVYMKSKRPLNTAHSYFEIEAKNIPESPPPALCIGIANADAERTGMAGWEFGSFGYHNDDGKVFMHGLSSDGGETWATGDIVGCGIEEIRPGVPTIFFTKNGKVQGRLMFPTTTGPHYPLVAGFGNGVKFRINFGKDEFKWKPGDSKDVKREQNGTI